MPARGRDPTDNETFITVVSEVLVHLSEAQRKRITAPARPFGLIHRPEDNACSEPVASFVVADTTKVTVYPRFSWKIDLHCVEFMFL